MPPAIAGIAALLGAAGILWLLAPVEAAPRHVKGLAHACPTKRHERRSSLEDLVLAARPATAATTEPAVAAPSSEAITAARAGVAAVSTAARGRFSYTESWLRGSLVDPDLDTEAPRVTFLGRVLRPGSDDRDRGMPGARVQLIATFSEPDAPAGLNGDDLKLALGAVPIEQRSLFRSCLGADTVSRVAVLGETETDRRGRFVFAVDPQRLPDSVSFYATATVDLNGKRWTRTTSDSIDVRVSEVSGALERTFDGLELAPTTRIVVLARLGGEPVAGALVAIDETRDEDFSGITDAQGRFELEIAGGSARVRVSRPGLSTVVKRIRSDKSASAVFDLSKEKPVLLHVVDAAGKPVESASYSVHDAGGLVADGNADESGAATILGLAPGTSYRIDASGPDLAQGSGSATLAGTASSVTVQLGTAGVISVRLLYDPSVPDRVRTQRNVTCHLEYQAADGAWSETASASPDMDDTCSFGHLEGGAYQVYTTEEKLAPSFSGPFHLDASAQTSLSLEVGYGHVVTAWVLDADLNRRDANVFLGGTQLKVSTNSGWLEVRVPTRGTTLTLQADNFAPLAVDAGPERSHLGDLVLSPGTSGN